MALRVVVFFILSFSAFPLEKILEENLDVVDYCLINHLNLSATHEKIGSLYDTCKKNVELSSSKMGLRDLLLTKYMNDKFIRMILSAYQNRRLSESKTLLSYLVADFKGYDDLKESFSTRLIAGKRLLRHSNDIPHFHTSNKRLSFIREQISFKYDGKSYNLFIEANSKHNISTIKTSRYFSLISHAVHGLMQIGQFTPIDISLTREKDDGSYGYIDPNYLLSQLYSMTKEESVTNFAMLGDVNSQGEYLRYGYFRSSLAGLSLIERYVLVSRKSKQQILEAVKVEGIQVLFEKIFISPESLEDAFGIYDSPSQYYELSEIYERLVKNIKFKSKWPGIIKSLDRILEKNPEFLSAEILKDVLTGKVKNQLSFASSFREFNWVFRRLDIEKGVTPDFIAAVKVDIIKVSKSIHPEFRLMLKSCLEIAEDRLALFKIPKPKFKSKGTILSKGGNSYRTVSQRLYKKIREVRLKRDILLDKQKVLESIFDR